MAGWRLDKFLATLDFIPSRARAAELIGQGRVGRAGKALKASYRVQPGETIEVNLPPPQPTSLVPLDKPLDILFEDEDLVVVNKPAGLVVHPAAGHAQDTLVNILLHRVDRLSMGFNEQRPGIVHRLDRDTSGVLVVAKNDPAHHFLAAQFREKTAHRIYWAIVHGVPKIPERSMKSHLARHPTDRKRFASSPGGHGKVAITHYRLREALAPRYSWLELTLETGRTHQIRVHLSEAGLPILGDPLYGRRDAFVARLKRVALHACELGFEHPRSREKMYFRVPWPPELKTLAEELGFHDV
jgi:23S rRNA pseudouridine1911/1915/1917 synthase